MVAVFQNPQALLHRERKTMRAHERAINHVLSKTPVTASGRLEAEWPEAPNLLVALDTHCEGLDRYHPIAMARRDIIEYIRLHPDVDGTEESEGFADYFQIGELVMDQIFRDAMVFEAPAN